MSSPDRADDLVGRRLGSYRIEAALGRGSMAEVYRARDVLTRGEVALKVHTRRDNEASKRRFHQEARATNLLRHPGIVEVLETGTEGDVSFIAMELVRGEPLSAVMQAGPLPWQEAVRIAIGIAEALAHAHAAGVMHRDLKPSNVLVTDEGRIKLVDFGLAKRVGSVPDAGDGATVWDWAFVHTQPGAVLGTPAYMAPEQARAGHVDARADVFALGVILWEAIAARPLFRRATPAATLRAILTEQAPELDTVVIDVPRALAEITTRALRKSPEDRFPDASAMLAALRALPAASALSIAVGRVSERHSQSLTEPTFLGRARDVRVTMAALEAAERTVVLLGLPGMGRRRLGLEALARLGCTRPLVASWAGVEPLAKAFKSRPHDSLLLDAGDRAAEELLEPARAIVGPRGRIVVRARRVGAIDVPTVRVRGLSDDDGVRLLGMVRTPDARNAGEALLSAISRGVGGHPQSLTTIATRLLSEEAGVIAASLELSPGWPEVLGALGTLRAWLAQEIGALGPHGRAALSALAAVPSATEPDARELVQCVVPEPAGVLEQLLGTTLLESAPHPELLAVPRLAVPALVRRSLMEHGDAEAIARARSLCLSRSVARAEATAARTLSHPDEHAARELWVEREPIVELASEVLSREGAAPLEVDQAARGVIALLEGDTHERGTEVGESALDHLLARLVARGLADRALELRALVLRLAPRPPLLTRVEVRAIGLSEARSLAAALGDAGALARLELAGAEDEASGRPDGEVTLRAAVESALGRLSGDVPPWLRQHVLEQAAELRMTAGDAGPARGAFRNAIQLAEERGDARAEARLRHRLGRLAACAGELDEARREATEALPLAITVGDVLLVGLVECSLAELALLSGDPERARTHVDRAASGSAQLLSRAALIAGHVELAAGHAERARTVYASATLHAERYRDTAALAVGQAALAAALAAHGDRPAANDALVRATLAARTLSPSLRAVVLGWRGHLDRILGGSDEEGARAAVQRAKGRFDEATRLSRGESEAGTGPHVGRHLLDATEPAAAT